MLPHFPCINGRLRDQAYALFRIVTGFLFLCHGSQKLFSFPVPAMEGIPAFITYGAGGIELVGGLLVMIGLFGRWAAFISSGTMAAAYWMAHGLNAPFPIQNGGELAALYCFAFLLIATSGSGIWSVDGARSTS
jgi:putative oxidoreductase